MTPTAPPLAAPTDRVLTDGIEPLVDRLLGRGCTVVAPVGDHGVISLGEIDTADELASGWSDVQEPGRYGASPGGTTMFGHAAPNLPWRRWLRPVDHVVVRASTDGDAVVVDPPPARSAPLAFVGVQACDLAALGRLDVILDHDVAYRSRRERLTVIAVACTDPASTCFCASAGTGPTPGAGADIVVRELADGTLLATASSETGSTLLDEIGPLPVADRALVEAAERRISEGASQQTRRLDPAAIAAAAAAPDDHRWQAVADRCLMCGNCTLVCPTCFCTSIVDSTSLDGGTYERRERWDSCFGLDFSYLHGGSVRTTAVSRYRQWYLHKLVTWHDQFGESGCVGCGRCITWCPTGIDITEVIVHD
jgi:sulfhydrogenase subunit beta (sulfur reductase)